MAAGNQPAGLSMVDYFFYAIDRSGQDRCAAGHGFGNRQSKWFRVRINDQQIAGANQFRRIFALAEKDNPIRYV